MVGATVSRRRRRVRKAGTPLASFVLAGGLAMVPAPVSAGAAGQVTLASHIPSSTVTTANTYSAPARSSADGAFVVFESEATNLVTGQTDANNATFLPTDVFLYSRATGAVTLVSHAAAGPTTTGNAGSLSPVISADGAYVAFVSVATDLVTGQIDPGGSGATADVFLYSRATGAVTLVSHVPGSAVTTAGGSNIGLSISADGAFVAFESFATNLVAGQIDNNNLGGSRQDVFLFSRATGALTLVSHHPSSAVTTGNGGSSDPKLSADGAYVAFQSDATDLVAGQISATGLNSHTYLAARATGVVLLVSHNATSTTTTANAGAHPTGTIEPAVPLSINADGAFVVFVSRATDLIAGQSDGNVGRDVFLYNRVTGVTTLVSHVPAAATTTGDAPSNEGSISADGSFVALTSSATNLVAGQVDSASTSDVFLSARATGAVTLVSHATSSGVTAVGGGVPALNADGAFVAFHSAATNVVAGQTDTNGGDDVFVYDRGTGASTLASHIPASATTTGSAGAVFGDVPSISADGTVVAFGSLATNLVAGQVDANGKADVFVFRRTGTPVATADFDGSGSTDISVFRPSDGSWQFRDQATVFHGINGDIPVACDYSGDGRVDVAVFRPSVGGWYVEGQATAYFGLDGDIPVPGDYDGDGLCDRAVFRPSVGGWYVQSQATVFLGRTGDIPVPGDYDGNGIADMAVFRPSVGGWYRDGAATTFFGLDGDVPVPGDYDGNGSADVAVFRPGVGGWYRVGQSPQFLGLGTDIPQPGDYDGNATTDLAVYRPATGAWYVGDQAPVFFGLSTDLPVPLPSAIRMGTGN